MPKNQQDLNPIIRRARVDSLDFYEITDEELTTLEHGSPGSLFLLFATFLISIALSFLISLLTTKIENLYVYILFVIITIIGFVLGSLFLCLWIRECRSSISVSKKIRNRMKEEDKIEELKQKSIDPTSTLGN